MVEADLIQKLNCNLIQKKKKKESASWHKAVPLPLDHDTDL